MPPKKQPVKDGSDAHARDFPRDETNRLEPRTLEPATSKKPKREGSSDAHGGIAEGETLPGTSTSFPLLAPPPAGARTVRDTIRYPSPKTGGVTRPPPLTIDSEEESKMGDFERRAEADAPSSPGRAEGAMHPLVPFLHAVGVTDDQLTYCLSPAWLGHRYDGLTDEIARTGNIFFSFLFLLCY